MQSFGCNKGSDIMFCHLAEMSYFFTLENVLIFVQVFLSVFFYGKEHSNFHFSSGSLLTNAFVCKATKTLEIQMLRIHQSIIEDAMASQTKFLKRIYRCITLNGFLDGTVHSHGNSFKTYSPFYLTLCVIFYFIRKN